MKKIIFLTLLTFLTINSIAQNKLGHINAQQIMSQMPEFKAAQTTLQEFGSSLEGQLTSMTAEYQESVKQYQANESTYTDLVKQDKIAEITGLEQRIQAFQQNAQQSLQDKEIELLKPINTKLLDIINKVAEEGGYTYIFTSEIFLYAKESQDIGDLVKQKLGL